MEIMSSSRPGWSVLGADFLRDLRVRQLLEVAGPGAILGLSESMAAVKYRATVLAAEETKAVFIPREEFLAFLHEQLRLLFAGGTPVE